MPDLIDLDAPASVESRTEFNDREYNLSFSDKFNLLSGDD